MAIIYAESGYWQDIQNAVDQAQAGDIVFIPEGAFYFVYVDETWTGARVVVPAGIDLFGAPTQRDAYGQVIEWKTILVMPSEVEGNDEVGVPTWFKFVGDGDPDKPSRFSDIKLVGYRSIDPESVSMHQAVGMVSVVDFRIDHCYFEHTTAGIGCGTEYLGVPKIRGVIDHCKLINIYGSPTPYETLNIGYGVHVLLEWHENVWDDIEEVLGHYNDYTVFIEDCYFEKWRHCICANNGGHIVFRHNTVKYDFGYGSLDIHEQRVETAGRALEIYDNSLLEPIVGWGQTAINWRGGGGVAFDNTVTGYLTFAWLIENPDQEDIYEPQDIWIWNNDINQECSLVVVYGDIVEDRDYFLREPTLEDDGFVYTPYPYPHPLTLEGNGNSELFSDGFETLPFTGSIYCPPWTSTGGSPIVVNTQKHHGLYSSYYYDAVYDKATKTIDGQTTIFLRAYIRLTQLPAANEFVELLRFRGGGSTIVGARIKYEGVMKVGFRRYYPSQADSYVAFDWQINTWYCLEIKFVKYASTGEYRLYVDGEEKVNDTGLDTSGASDADEIYVGLLDAYEALPLYVDCVVVADEYIGEEPENDDGNKPSRACREDICR